MPKPTRVLYVHNSPLIGGANRVLLGLLEKLDRTRFEPWSIIPGSGPMEAELKRRDIPFLIEDVLACVTKGSKLSRAASATKLAFRLSQRGFGILHAQSPLTYKVPSLALRYGATRRLCHLHFPPDDATQELEWAFRIEPHMVLSCSESVASGFRPAMQALYPDVPLYVAINFADTERFSPGPPPRDLMEELRLDEASHVVAICGQVSERKGHPDFMRMAHGLLSSFPGAKFLVAGEDILTRGAYQAKMEALCAELGISKSVSFLGYREDVPGVLRSSDVVVLPSSAEGMPLSLIEAAACGTPVVAYDIPGVDEVVVRDVTGKLVPLGDVGALTEAVRGILRDEDARARLAREARRLAEEKFSLLSYAKEMEARYNEVLAPVRAS